MLIVTTDSIPGQPITNVHGTAFGIALYTRGAGGGIFSVIRSFFGREAKYYSLQLEETRAEAIKSLSDRASALGGTAVVAFHFDTNTMVAGVTEVVAYGTVVTTAWDTTLPLAQQGAISQPQVPSHRDSSLPPPRQPVRQTPSKEQPPTPPPSRFY